MRMNSRTKLATAVLAVISLLDLTKLSHASSVSAYGTVYSNTSSNFKIERSDGSKLAAACPSGPISNECAIASNGDEAWGRASCTGGACTWTCLDVNPFCSNYTGQTVNIDNAGIVSKEMCAGVTYLTIIAVGLGEFTARCNSGSQAGCDAVGLNDTIDGQIHFFCSEVEVVWLTIN